MKNAFTFAIFVAMFCSGCVVDSQRYAVKPDGSYEVKVSLTTFMMNASAVGMRSEWTADKSGMIYGDSLTNVNTAPNSETVEAITAGIVRGFVSSGVIK